MSYQPLSGFDDGTPQMSNAGPSTDWVRSERTSPVLWSIRIVGPAATVVLIPLLFYLNGLIPVVGYAVTAAIVVALVAAELALSRIPLNQLTASGVRIVPLGMEVLTRSGKTFIVPWEGLTIAASGSRGFGVVRYTWPEQGARLLSPNQFAAVKAARPSGEPDRTSQQS